VSGVHARAHDHGPAPTGDAAFRRAVLLNAGYVLVEAAAGLVLGSLALLADAAHNLADVAGLLIAWAATALARRPPTRRFTYGLGRGTVLAALANATTILVGVGAVIWEAVQRLAAPPPVPGAAVLLVALLGIAVNAGTALLFRDRAGHDLNARGAFLHMAADAAVSLAVVAAAAGILLTGWAWLDPAVAILVSGLVAWTAFDLLRASLGLSFDAVPRGIDLARIERFLASRPGVESVHDLHVWPLSTTSTALTAHLVMPAGHPGDAFLEAVAEELEEGFAIGHATLQIETGAGAPCRLAPAEVV
jgi:cobalt-zinc-cadmium efflux system protein